MPSDHGPIGVRHRWPDRAFHWVTAASTLALAGSAFLPILDIRFDWVPIHWISGVVLTAAILFHLVRLVVALPVRDMLPDLDDLREVSAHALNREPQVRASKFDAYQKGMHWAAALTLVATTLTGLLMLLKIDTPFWRRDPAILSDQDWGIVYVIHGFAALLVLFVIIVHVYFSILPEHRAILWSMIAGRGPLHARGGAHEPD